MRERRSFYRRFSLTGYMMAPMVSTIAKLLCPSWLRPGRIVKNAIFRRSPLSVLSGPFAGMEFFPEGAVPAKYLLGTYESELHRVIETLCRYPFDTIVDVGAGTGYYAVGLALRNPLARIIAFEPERKHRDSIVRTALVNNVETRIDVRGACDPMSLADALSPGVRCLLFMDCEGSEGVLLDPVSLPRLKDCHIVVELHDFVDRGIAGRVTERFRNTHSMNEIWSQKRRQGDFPVKLYGCVPQAFFKGACLYYMDEQRPEPMRWLFLEPIIRGEG